MPQVNFNTRIEYETHQLLLEYIAEENLAGRKISQAAITDAALVEYIQRRRKGKAAKEKWKGDK